VGKGANCIVSMLHHFFRARGLGESSVYLHADNCTGQNKNRYMMYYCTSCGGSALGSKNLFSTSQAHKICSQLVLWPSKAKILKDKNWRS